MMNIGIIRCDDWIGGENVRSRRDRTRSREGSTNSSVRVTESK